MKRHSNKQKRVRQSRLLKKIRDGKLAVGHGERPRRMQLIDAKHAVATNIDVAPVEHLIWNRMLATRNDYTQALMIRSEVATYYEAMHRAQSISGLQSVDYDIHVDGGGSGLTPEQRRIHGARRLAEIHDLLPSGERTALELLVVKEEWIFQRCGSPEIRRHRLRLFIRALDRLAVWRDLIDKQDFMRCWGGHPLHPPGLNWLYDPEPYR